MPGDWRGADPLDDEDVLPLESEPQWLGRERRVMPGEPRTNRRIKELMKEWRMLRFGLSEEDAAEAWAESMALHEEQDRLAAPPPVAPDGADLDVETLARAMHEGPHHYRGGADDSLAKTACIQFGWQESQCLRRATALAERYRRLRAGEGGKG